MAGMAIGAGIIGSFALAEIIKDHESFSNKKRKLILYFSNQTSCQRVKISQLKHHSGKCDSGISTDWHGHGQIGMSLHCEKDHSVMTGTTGTFKISVGDKIHSRSAYIYFSNPYIGCCKIGFSYSCPEEAKRNTKDGYAKEIDLGATVYLTPQNSEFSPGFAIVVTNEMRF